VLGDRTDPALGGVVLVDFGGFDEWCDEDERVMSHPRDPFHRVDVLRNSRDVAVAIDSATVAESWWSTATAWGGRSRPGRAEPRPQSTAIWMTSSTTRSG
jgi:hypothetical protein